MFYGGTNPSSNAASFSPNPKNGYSYPYGLSYCNNEGANYP